MRVNLRHSGECAFVDFENSAEVWFAMYVQLRELMHLGIQLHHKEDSDIEIHVSEI